MRRHTDRVLVVGLLFLVAACGSSAGNSFGGGGSPGTGGVAGESGGASGSTGGTPLFGTGGSSGSSGSGGGAAVCKKIAEACTDSTECCDGTICNNTAGALELNGCHQPCTQSSDCSTGCCVLFTGSTRGICGDAKWCSCGAEGATCSSQLPKCCDGSVCLAADVAQTSYECKKLCTKASDCSTNCCVAIPSLNESACLDKTYCP
jgi:hypothetical protein